MNKSKVRSLITIACTISGFLGIIDFYLNWINKMAFFEFIKVHLVSVIGIIGVLILCYLWIYWKITDYINYQKTEIIKIQDINSKLIIVINNHADCLNIREPIKFKNDYGSSVFLDRVPEIIPLKINDNELNRDNK